MDEDNKGRARHDCPRELLGAVLPVVVPLVANPSQDSMKDYC